MGEKPFWVPGQSFTVQIQDYSFYPENCGVENGNSGLVTSRGVISGTYWATIQTSTGIVWSFPIRAADMAECEPSVSEQHSLSMPPDTTTIATLETRMTDLDKLVRVYNGAVKIGDVVRMRIGGPNMCIKSFQESYGTATVQWFDNENHLHEEKVPLSALKNV